MDIKVKLKYLYKQKKKTKKNSSIKLNIETKYKVPNSILTVYFYALSGITI